MRYAKPLLRFLSLRHASCFLCLSLISAAVAMDGVGSAGAKKGAAPAKARKAVAPARPALQTSCDGGQRVGAACEGLWGPLKPLRTVPIHISLLPDRRLLYWGRDKVPGQEGQWWDQTGRSETYTWNPLNGEDPLTGAGQEFPNPNTNLFCSGHSFLPDGRLLVTGGHVRDDRYPMAEGIGARDVNIFDYRNNTWARATTPGSPPQPVTMTKGRWYPSHVTLASGETAIFSGGDWDGSKLNQSGQPVSVENPIPDIYRRDGTLRPFTDSRAVPIYPYIHLAPNGQVFIAGPGPDASRYFDPEANGGGGLFGDDLADFDPTHLNGSSVLYDSVGGKVMMVGGQSFFGGTSLPDVRAIDLTELPPRWRPAPTPEPWLPAPPPDPKAPAPMNFSRNRLNATLLPDGKVLVTGGTSCPGFNSIGCKPNGQTLCTVCNYDGDEDTEPCLPNESCLSAACRDADCQNRAITRPELWDPATNTWSVLAASQSGIPRVYHSVALLLPDGRVLVGGGGRPAAAGETVPTGTPGVEETCTETTVSTSPNCVRFGHANVEIFSPPYLFAPNGLEAVRPVIVSAPSSVSYNQAFSVETCHASQASSAVLIRLPSVTHGLNFDQRRVVLTGRQVTSGTTVSFTAPAGGRVCPPGYYMLFILDASGVPSVAKIIKVDTSTQPPPSAPAFFDAAAGPAPRVNLAWGASTGQLDHYEVERAPTRCGPFETVGANVTGTTFTDTTASSGVTYVYRVRAVGPSGASSYSNPDIATTVAFTNHPLTPGVPLKAEHLAQLRQAVNAVRVAAGLPQVNWADPVLSATRIRAAHMQQLRENLDPALGLLGLPVNPYSDPTLTTDFTPLRAAHWQEIRDRVR